ncbi:hypothetical protein SUGI_1031480 [Cryptomeria japonica]|uniref:bidirectional sugar transporter SWEET5 n=1 Tax=Cryptomeria japonica TaxID=3369 RepID=UPI0024147151|nr:bidirectional sugar transporter SWEET5 [Cryptomeria japonica]GLJ48902.1 hypothetical protein SUGI_1031480 [Cryptomeria japonica]
MHRFTSILEAKSSSWVAAGNILRVTLFLSPFPTIKSIINEKDTGSFSAFNYICTILNCVLWTFYGVHLDQNNKFLISYVNGVGALLHTGYLTIHYLHAPQKEKARIVLLKVASLMIMGTMIASAIFLVPKSDRVTVVGWACGVLNIVMHAAPLSVLKQVLATNDVRSMPFLVSFFSLLNAAVWLAFSFLHKDAKVTMIPNAVATIFAVIEVLVYLMYCENTTTSVGEYNSEPMGRMEHMTA